MRKLSLPPKTLDLQGEFGQLGVIRSYGPGAELLQQGLPADEATSEESFRSDRRICFNPGHAAEIVGEASRKIEQRPPIVPALIRQGKRAPNSHSSLIDQRRQQFIEECSA